MADEFRYDVFLSHSAMDKPVVREVAARLRMDGVKVWHVSSKRRREGGFDEWVLKPGDSIPSKIGLPSLMSYGKTGKGPDEKGSPACPVEAQWRRRMLCMSANAFGSDWAQLARHAVASLRRRKAGTFRFRDPLNRERRFLPPRLDDAPIKGSLAQFLHINCPAGREREYARLLDACRSPAKEFWADLSDRLALTSHFVSSPLTF